jgi:hypothetical protein
VHCNQIDDVLNISTPTACQDAETIACVASTSTTVAVTALIHDGGVINMKAPELFLSYIFSPSVMVQRYLRVCEEIKI